MNSRKHQGIIEKLSSIFDIYPREYVALGFFVLFFIIIVCEIFSYTVIHYDFYSKLAEKQQTGEREIPVTRGNIYTAPSKTMIEGTVYSTSVDLMDLAIDPQIEGDIDALKAYFTDMLYNEFCYIKNTDDCYRALLRFTKQSIIYDYENTEDYIKSLIELRLKNLFSETYVSSVRLRESINPDEERKIIAWNMSGVYPHESGLYVNPQEIVSAELFAQKYQEMFGGNTQDILYSIRKRERRYIPIHQKLSLKNSDLIEQKISEEKIALKQGIIKKSDTIGGFIILNPNAQRIYPEGEIGSQIIGFLNNAGEGNYGIEGYFEDLLRGNPGELVSKKDINGRPIDPISFGEDATDALEGVDIYTTIDRNVQKIVEKVLKRGVQNYQANKGSIVVMEPKTGRILSLASYPSYDPNNPGEVYTLKQVRESEYPNPEIDLLGKSVFVEDKERGEAFLYKGKEILLREALREEYILDEVDKYIYVNEYGAGVYRNDTISSLYEPGSIMKAITVAIGIDSGEIRPYDMYNDIGEVTIDNFTIANVDRKCLGYNSFTHALGFSCNVGMIRIVQRVGKALVHKYLQDFGFGEETGIKLQGEAFSRLDPHEKWPTSKLLTTSYGLGISVTPLQMASAYSVLANGGVYMKPYIVEKVQDAAGNITEYEPQVVRRVLRETTSQAVTKMLVKSVEQGVANKGRVLGYSIAGKTGTSQIAYKGKYETGNGSTYASFAGYAPAEDPQFVIVVKLDRPRTTIYGGQSSAYIFSELASELLDYYAIPKRED